MGLKKKHNNIKALIIGQDYSDGKWEQLILENDLTENVELLGLLPNSEVLKYMQQAKVLVHTSTFESQGYVFLEALKNGMQVVSRQVGIAKKGSKWFIAEDLPSFIEASEQALSVKHI